MRTFYPSNIVFVEPAAASSYRKRHVQSFQLHFQTAVAGEASGAAAAPVFQPRS